VTSASQAGLGKLPTVVVASGPRSMIFSLNRSIFYRRTADGVRPSYAMARKIHMSGARRGRFADARRPGVRTTPWLGAKDTR
jgi:hypothetical protein